MPQAAKGGGRSASSASARLDSHAARSKGASASSSSTTAPAWQHPDRRRRQACRTTRAKIKQLSAGCSVTVEGEVKASPGKGQATEVAAPRSHGPRLGRSRDVSAAEESGTRSSSCARSPTCGRGPTRSARSPACAIASAGRSTISFRSRAFSTSTRRSSRPATAKGPARCSRSPRSIWQSCRKRDGDDRLRAGLLPRPAYLTVSGQLEGEIFACALGKIYTFGPTFRAENSNTSRHLAEFWMVEPEMAFYELTDNMDLAEAFLKRIFRDVLDALPRGHAVLRRARSTRRCSATLEHIVDSEFVRLPYTEAVEHPAKVGPDVRIPGRVGHTTCRPSTSAISPSSTSRAR